MRLKSLIVMLAILIPVLASSQCRKFTKNKCIPALGEFIPNENFNSAVLVPGDEAELMMTFYAGQEYRIMVCAEEILGEVNFALSDEDGTEFFNSGNSDKPHFDFGVANTQQVRVKLMVPAKDNYNELVHEGCTTVMVGYKEPTKEGEKL